MFARHAHREFLVKFIRRNPRRLRDVLQALGERAPGVLQALAVHGEKIDLSPAVELLLPRLSARRAAARREAAATLRLLAEAGVLLTNSLRPFLDKRDPEFVREIARAMTIAGESNVVDEILAHRSAHVRAAAVSALRQDTTRCAAAFLDPVEAVRESALGVPLSYAASPDNAILARLAASDHPSVAIFLRHLAGREPQRVHDALPEGHPLRRMIMEGGHRAPCSLCHALPRSINASFESDLPAEVKCLVAVNGTLYRCPECGAYYRYDYEDEWDDMSHSEWFSWRRLSPTAAIRELRGAPREEAARRYDELIAENRRNLDHVDEKVRRDAAWVMTEHGESLDELLTHADLIVRSEVTKVLRESERDVVPPASLLDDVDPSVRFDAATLLARHYTRQEDWAAVERLLQREDGGVLFGALQALRLTAPEEADLSRFADRALALLAHASESVRQQAGYLLERAGGPPIDALCRLLGDTRGEVRKTAADVLLDLAREGAEVSAAVPALAELLEDESAGWHALKTLEAHCGNGHDVSAALSAVARTLARGTCRDVEGAMWMLPRAAAQGADASVAVWALASLTRSRSHGQSAIRVLQEISRRECDLAPAVSALRRVVTASGDAFERQEAVTRSPVSGRAVENGLRSSACCGDMGSGT